MAIFKHKRTGELKEANYAPYPSYDWVEVRSARREDSLDVGDVLLGVGIGMLVDNIFDSGNDSGGGFDGGGGDFGGGGGSGEW